MKIRGMFQHYAITRKANRTSCFIYVTWIQHIAIKHFRMTNVIYFYLNTAFSVKNKGLNILFLIQLYSCFAKYMYEKTCGRCCTTIRLLMMKHSRKNWKGVFSLNLQRKQHFLIEKLKYSNQFLLPNVDWKYN